MINIIFFLISFNLSLVLSKFFLISAIIQEKHSPLPNCRRGGRGGVSILAKKYPQILFINPPPSFPPTLSILTTIFNNTFYYPSPLFKNLRGAQAAIWNFLYTITKWSCLLVGYTFSCFILSVIVLMFELIVFWSACKNHKSMKYKIKKTWK